jgi:hypothetical protein
MIYLIIIIHTFGSESISIEANSSDDAINLARLWAINEGLVLLRCFLG